MWNLWKRRPGAEKPENGGPGKGEFWLTRGEFRDILADPAKVGYHGLFANSFEGISPPTQAPEQRPFYRLVFHTVKGLLEQVPAAVLVEECPRSERWQARLPLLKERAAEHGGVFLEERGGTCPSYAFLFPALPPAFLEELYWWWAEYACWENLRIQYSALGAPVSDYATVTQVGQGTTLNLLIDEDHPVLILQAAPDYPTKRVFETLSAVCEQEGWTLSVREESRQGK